MNNPYSRPLWFSYLDPPSSGLFYMERDHSHWKRVAKDRKRAKAAKRHKQQMRHEGKL